MRPVPASSAIAVGLVMLACRTQEPASGSAPVDPTAQPGSAGDPASPGDGPEDPAADPNDGPADAGAEIRADDGRPADLLTFAHGAIPLRVEGSGARHGATFEEAVEAIDGSDTPYAMVRKAPADVVTEFVIELPAPTTFTGFAVPHVHEVPSKFTTFSREVEVLGSSRSATEGFAVLASAILSTHARDDEHTALTMRATVPVRWIKLRLTGGIAVQAEASSFEFSEIVGHGAQEQVPRLDTFAGSWRTRGANFDLAQQGALVSGCYDDVGELEGSVTGNILRARGTAKGTGVVSLFVLTVMPDGELRGLRSTNGAPFRVITSVAAAAGVEHSCPRLAPPTLGCGSVIHGIGFDFDSATLRDDAAPILDRLYAGLGRSKAIRVEGHTSSEGDDAHNRELSRRRAAAIVDDLVRRGLPRDRITAVGRGSEAPIADNRDAAGRSLNRRVEIRCG